MGSERIKPVTRFSEARRRSRDRYHDEEAEAAAIVRYHLWANSLQSLASAVAS
jgi:hypothetical protein